MTLPLQGAPFSVSLVTRHRDPGRCHDGLSRRCAHQRSNSRCQCPPSLALGGLGRRAGSSPPTWRGTWPLPSPPGRLLSASEASPRLLHEPSGHTPGEAVPVGVVCRHQKPPWVCLVAFTTPGTRTVPPQRRPGSERRPLGQKAKVPGKARAMTSAMLLRKGRGGSGRGGGARAPRASHVVLGVEGGVDRGTGQPWPELACPSCALLVLK